MTIILGLLTCSLIGLSGFLVAIWATRKTDDEIEYFFDDIEAGHFFDEDER